MSARRRCGNAATAKDYRLNPDVIRDGDHGGSATTGKSPTGGRTLIKCCPRLRKVTAFLDLVQRLHMEIFESVWILSFAFATRYDKNQT